MLHQLTYIREKVRVATIAKLKLLDNEVLGLLRFHDAARPVDKFGIQVAVKAFIYSGCRVDHGSRSFPQRPFNSPRILRGPKPERFSATKFCASAELKPLSPTMFSVPAVCARPA